VDELRGQPIRRVVLLGFMGSGKSTVGPLLASRLGWRYLDLDQDIERRTGRRVTEIFRSDGEAAFRALEAAATEELLAERRLVLAPGGGWIAGHDVHGLLGADTLSVWLQVTAEVALQRLAQQRGSRPLLEVPDPLAEATRLLREREALYAHAGLHVSTVGRAPDEIAIIIEHHVHLRGHVPGRT
jgi:shikimate kinase